jgi:hypothetical protein
LSSFLDVDRARPDPAQHKERPFRLLAGLAYA